jgi:hypothetical protein
MMIADRAERRGHRSPLPSVLDCQATSRLLVDTGVPIRERKPKHMARLLMIGSPPLEQKLV